MCFCFLNTHTSTSTLNEWIFRKKSGRLSTAGPQNFAFGSHCSAKFRPILDCIIPNFKLKYEDPENIKTDCVDTPPPCGRKPGNFQKTDGSNKLIGYEMSMQR